MRQPRRRAAAALLALLLGVAACQQAAAFDYWVLALSWSPEFCASDKGASAREQCSVPRTFIAHGLWPQYERGYPEFCTTRERVPQAVIDRVRRITPAPGLIIHQWNKHGSCSGLSATGYFERLKQAYSGVNIPARYLRDNADRRLRSADVERAFIEANPGLSAAALSLQCRRQQLSEVRVCLDLQLKPRACSADIADTCGKEIVVRSPQR